MVILSVLRLDAMRRKVRKAISQQNYRYNVISMRYAGKTIKENCLLLGSYAYMVKEVCFVVQRFFGNMTRV